ncbi:MAG: hypothetical protein BIFFINMI_02394 [Phycisphaerae bacterium]|nr:hypothetical protein [Phycisphaerae bacterium]
MLARTRWNRWTLALLVIAGLSLAGCKKQVSQEPIPPASTAKTEPLAHQTDQQSETTTAKTGGPGETATNPEPPPPVTTLPQPTAKPAVTAEEIVARADEMLAKARAYLLKSQAPDGSWVSKYGPAVTALAVKALVEAGQPVDSEPVTKAVKFVLSTQKTEGEMKGAFVTQELANYNTSISLSALVYIQSKMTGKPYDAQIKEGLTYLRGCQWDSKDGVDKSNAVYGGFGYGEKGKETRPDMSNTAMSVNTLNDLKSAGYITADDPMFSKVVVFLEHSQNRSESNKVGTYAVGNDGGFIYAPASDADPSKAVGQSKAGSVDLPGESKSGLRSYGSMTYAGFMSFLYSGLTMDDPRVKDAFKWIAENYTLQQNPGLPEKQKLQGLYYYYMTFARALAAAGKSADVITTPDGQKHNWRADLVNQLNALQNDDGSWTNMADRWNEGSPDMVTAFCTTALTAATRDLRH